MLAGCSSCILAKTLHPTFKFSAFFNSTAQLIVAGSQMGKDPHGRLGNQQGYFWIEMTVSLNVQSNGFRRGQTKIDQPRSAGTFLLFFFSPLLLIKLSPKKEQQCKLFLAILQKGTFPRNQNVMLTELVDGEGWLSTSNCSPAREQSSAQLTSAALPLSWALEKRHFLASTLHFRRCKVSPCILGHADVRKWGFRFRVR